MESKPRRDQERNWRRYLEHYADQGDDIGVRFDLHHDGRLLTELGQSILVVR